MYTISHYPEHNQDPDHSRWSCCPGPHDENRVETYSNVNVTVGSAQARGVSYSNDGGGSH